MPKIVPLIRSDVKKCGQIIVDIACFAYYN